jgi:nicotinate-nucleotide adenylyltransferase
VTGILGGTFDPPHDGHIALARAALDRLGLDRLLVLVAARPGHREVEAPAEARLELASAAFAGLPVEVELDEHPRTIDLLREHRFADPLLVIGADQLAGFISWREPEEILRLARLGVGSRPGYPRERLSAVLDRLDASDRILFFDIPPVDVSSTELRRRVRAGLPIDDSVPAAVARLVSERGLYRR